MEKKTKGIRSSSRRILRSPFCTPMSKGNSTCARKTKISLIDRLRDAVLRLIMFSALSKAAATTQGRKSNNNNNNANISTTCNYQYYPHHYHHEPHRTEALADCIEFIKKSAAAASDVEIRGGAAAEDDGSGRACSDAATEVVLFNSFRL